MDIIFADIFIVVSLLTLLAALLLVIGSVWHSLKVNKRKNKENGIPVLVATGALLYSKWSSAKRGIAYLN